MEVSASHYPFIIRKDLVFFSLFPALILGIFKQDIYFVLSVYFIIVTASDLFVRFVLKRKSSDYIDPQRLLNEQKATPQEFDTFCDSRTLFRFVSLLFAFFVSVLAYAYSYPFFEFLTYGYVASNFILVALAEFLSLIKAPVFFRIISQQNPRKYQRTAGTVSPSTYLARKALGLPPMPIE